MPTEEEQYAARMEAAGVEVPDLPKAETKEEPEAKPEKKEKESDEDDKSKKDDGSDGEDDGDKKPEDKPTTDKKRSIYADYKDKKNEAKEATARAEAAEAELAELKSKIGDVNKADNKEDKDEALDEFDAYAKKIGADPAAIKELRDLMLKGIKPDQSMQKDLLEFQEWKKENQQAIDSSNFDKEFKASLPELKEIFPGATEAEMSEIRAKLDTLAHTKGWNDRELSYIAFKNRKELTALVSPKKKGTESREKKDGDFETEAEFDPNPDFAKMSGPQMEAWNKQYKNQSGRGSKELIKGNDGKLMMT